MTVALTAIQLQSLLLKRTEGIMGCPTVAAARLTSCRYSTWCFVAAKTTVSSSSLMTSRSKWSRTASLSSARHDKKLSCNRTRHLQRLPPIGCPGGTGPLCPSPIVSQSRCVSGSVCPVPGPLCPHPIVSQAYCVSLCTRPIVSQACCVPGPLCPVPGPLCPNPIVSQAHCVSVPLCLIAYLAHCVPVPLCTRPIKSPSYCVSVPLSHCVSVPLCLIVYQAHCVPIPLCLSLIVYQASCVPTRPIVY